MKKTYTTPTLMVGDDVVHVTLTATMDGDEINFPDTFKVSIVGGVGYYL
jgi:hypothetical protein